MPVYSNPPRKIFTPLKFHPGLLNAAGDAFVTAPNYTGGDEVDQAQPNSYIVLPEFTTFNGEIITEVENVGPEAQKFYLQEGEEPWNHLIEGDEQIVAALDIARELRFIGVAAAPWGEPAVYLRGGNKIYVLDFFARKIYPVEVGSNKPLIQGRMWQGAIVVTDGWNVFEYSPQAGTQRNIGMPSKWGLPPNLVGDDAYQIIDLIAHDDELLAILVDTEEPATVLYRWNGVGWHQVGARMHDFFASYGFRVTFPLPGALFTDRSQAIIIPGANALTSPTEFGYWQFNMPTITHQPTVGLDTFGPSGARMYTGWIDGGFFDIDGTLLRMNTDSFFHDGDQQIILEYRLDNDPDSEETATWNRMVDENGTPSAFDENRAVLYFNETTPKAGIKFRTVQFRITFIRGSDATSSPEMRALTLVYLKTPELRTQWAFEIDVNRMIEMGAGEENDFWIDGAPATLESVWGKLRDLWTNEHELLSLEVPSILEDGETLYVKLTEIPVSFDDFREAVAGKGTIRVTLLEPVA